MLNRIGSFILVLCLLLCSAATIFATELLPAHAAIAAPNALSTFLQLSIFPIITALFMGIVSIFLDRLGKKYKVEALTQQNNIIEQLAYQGITKAEELAAKYAESGGAFSGQDKLSIAIQHILTFMPKVSEEQANSVVHALLAQIPGLGASGDKAIERYPMLSSSIAVPAAGEPEIQESSL